MANNVLEAGSHELRQHPLSAAYPAMAADDFKALCDSVESVGVQNPIVLFDSMVIDGWHRYSAAKACRAACPECGYSPCGKRCVSCGHERVKKSLIEHQAGNLVEVDFRAGKGGKIDKPAIWSECVSLCRFQGSPATAKNRAAHLYRSITGVWPRNLPDFGAVPTVEVSRLVANKAKANAIAFRARSA